MLDQSVLNGFTGTEQWTVLPVFGTWPAQEPATDPRPLATDGAMYVIQNGGHGGAYWLWEAFASHWRTNPELRKEPFLSITLRVFPEERGKSRSGLLFISDGDIRVLTQQDIEYTDFDEQGITLWFTTNVLLLPSEY
jgi:hypothetical protein